MTQCGGCILPATSVTVTDVTLYMPLVDLTHMSKFDFTYIRFTESFRKPVMPKRDSQGPLHEVTSAVVQDAVVRGLLVRCTGTIKAMATAIGPPAACATALWRYNAPSSLTITSSSRSPWTTRSTSHTHLAAPCPANTRGYWPSMAMECYAPLKMPNRTTPTGLCVNKQPAPLEIQADL